MKRFFLLLSLLFLTNSIVAHSADSADNKEYFCMGVSHASFGNVNHNDAQAALKTWANSFLKERALSLDVNVRLYKREMEVVEALLEEKLDAITVTTAEFMKLEVEPESIYLNVRGNDLYERYVIIVHRNSGISGLADLKGQKLIHHNSQRMVLALPWLEVLLADHSKGRIINWLSDLTETDNPSKGIFQVFFRQADAAVVTKDAFEIACELNPSCKKTL
jgi:ABC-type phosphate/phosphonate transport system substrate-binding protein